ncbi:transglutaminase-like domain-containing protein [Rhodovulum sp. DZ06]|uniref:transglutaminase-like domain-containing protein n=1 Tax=Rhodovulum sp. DZ06 TaxID=3425126 RepID=UPI003D348479
MRIRLGVEMAYDFAVPTPMVAMLHVRPERAGALETPDLLQADPPVPVQAYFDSFGNRCTRLTAPAGRFTMRVDAMMQDDGRLDPVLPDAQEHPIEGLPEHVLPFLIGSRYCETELLMQDAWRLFAEVEPGWGRVQAICDFVHNHVAFDYMQARATRTAAEAFAERKGVCRDYAHLAVALCRCMNIPARYCTGYISDIGLEPPYAEMDLAAWMEVWLDGAWRTFDPRTNDRRRGRVLMGVGRDAADVPLAHIFGPGPLAAFKVWIHRVDEDGNDLPNQLSDAEKAMIDVADGPRHHPPVDAATGGPATLISARS